MNIRKQIRRTTAITAGALMLAVGMTVALADRTPYRVLPPISEVEEETIPAAPPDKAAFAAGDEDLPRDGSALSPTAKEDHHSEDHTNHEHPSEPFVADPNVWVCSSPDDTSYMIQADPVKIEALIAVRDAVVLERSKDAGWMPTVEYHAAPDGCLPIEGMPTLEEWYRARSAFQVLNNDGSIKTISELEELVSEVAP